MPVVLYPTADVEPVPSHIVFLLELFVSVTITFPLALGVSAVI
jgi:hypothetical protein